MTNLTIEELDRLENMTPAEMIDEPEFMQAVYGKMASLCRRVLEAQANGGKMMAQEAGKDNEEAMCCFCDGYNREYYGDLYKAMHAAAPDMLEDWEDGL